MANQINIRLLALETLLECEKKNGYIKDSLDKTLFQNQFLSKQERSFLSRITEGVTEYQLRLDYIINLFSKIKINKCKPVIRIILRMGVYQMLYMDSVSRQTACDECVKLAKKKGFYNLTGFVNGVLRNVAANLDKVEYPKEEDNLEQALSIMYSVPEWLIGKLLQWYGKDLTKEILSGCMGAKDLTVRVNTALTSKEALVKKLTQSGISVKEGYYLEDALHLEHINYVRKIPGFMQGEFFVQDESSMLLCEALKKEFNPPKSASFSDKKIKVLDLCAAPGGKATHFSQILLQRGEIIARDLTEKKTAYIEENIDRLKLHNITTQVKDGLEFDESMTEWADVVIADLPCSGLGIMGKKNDIKYHLKEEQLQQLQQLQRDILKNAFCYVKHGGILLFSTCTINPGENIENAHWILTQGDFDGFAIQKQLPRVPEHCFIEDYMLQLLPGRDMCDGFFISAFKRK